MRVRDIFAKAFCLVEDVDSTRIIWFVGHPIFSSDSLVVVDVRHAQVHMVELVVILLLLMRRVMSYYQGGHVKHYSISAQTRQS